MDERYQDRQWLIRMYQQEGHSAESIARMCDASPAAIRYWLEKHEIPIRGKSNLERKLYDQIVKSQIE